MARITVEDCIKLVNNQYDLVILAKERAVQLGRGATPAVDPENDKTTVLKNYAEINGINDQRWHLLTSELSAIKSLKRDGFMLFADELPQGHAIKFILIDEHGNIRKYFDGTDEASLSILKKDISHLVKNIQST